MSRGLLDAQSHLVTPESLLAAAQALAAVVGPEELNAACIVPSVFHPASPGPWPVPCVRPARGGEPRTGSGARRSSLTPPVPA